MQIKADVTGCPVERPEVSDAAALGAALLAGVGVEKFASLGEAAAAAVRIDSVFAPSAVSVEQYQAPYAHYLQFSQRFQPAAGKLAEPTP